MREQDGACGHWWKLYSYSIMNHKLGVAFNFPAMNPNHKRYSWEHFPSPVVRLWDVVRVETGVWDVALRREFALWWEFETWVWDVSLRREFETWVWRREFETWGFGIWWAFDKGRQDAPIAGFLSRSLLVIILDHSSQFWKHFRRLHYSWKQELCQL